MGPTVNGEAAMSEFDAYQDLAKRYLDLWQKQLSGQVGDSNLAESMGQAIDMMNQGAQAFTAAVARQAATAGGRAQDGSATDGSAAAAAAHGHGGVDLADIARRLRVLEQRIAAMEARIGQTGSRDPDPSGDP